MISALGCGIGVDNFHLEKLRYHKIIIMTDADVDGSHIRTLLLTFFYRHMPALIENNFIYIAQPPLYRVNRKKSSRYIHSEKEMDDYLLELGLSDIHAYLSGHEEPLSSEELKTMLQMILNLESFISRLERKGIPFREFLGSRNEKGIFPRFQISLVDGPKFAYSTDEFEELRKSDEEAQKIRHEETIASIPSEEVTPEMRIFRPARLHFIELYEEDFLTDMEEKLKSFNFDLKSYLIANGPLLDLKDDSGSRETMYTLHDVVSFIRNNGRKGIEIQRYKGLGEMNADQLWETTMDPAKRTLIKVTLPDVVAADYMFTMLMGEEVPPRRAFIEQHALSVKNLDI